MNMGDRIDAYMGQRNGFEIGSLPSLTPKQRRRISKKDVCPKCTARGLDPCVTASGTEAKQPHVGRYKSA